jgi:hypothetical protein
VGRRWLRPADASGPSAPFQHPATFASASMRNSPESAEKATPKTADQALYTHYTKTNQTRIVTALMLHFCGSILQITIFQIKRQDWL